jgi:uncharacterized membrane protein
MRHLLLVLSVAVGLIAIAGADEPPKKYRVVTPKDDGIIASGINERGEIIGFDLLEEKDRPAVIAHVPFFASGKDVTHLPLLKGYTATFPTGVSDDGLVVGYVSRPIDPRRPDPLRNQAFLWDTHGGIRGLGVPEGFSTSFATGITRDGRRISGYAVGGNGMRAHVWDREGEGWKAVALPHGRGLDSNAVLISGDGRFVAAVDGGSPCLWNREASGRWARESIGDFGSLVPRSVNNSGSVVGVRFTPDGLTHAIVWTRSGGQRRLAPPEGYVRSEALAINNHDVVVGMIDGPRGSKIGPNGFIHEGGRLRILDEGGPNFASATAINDRGEIAGVMEKPEE